MTIGVYRRAALAAVALFTCTHVSAQLATGEFSRTLEIDGAVILDVTTGSGSIDIRQGPPGEVRVQGRISVGRGFWRSAAEAEAIVSRLESNPPIVVSGSRVEVGRIEDEDLRRNVSIGYDIVVPAGTSATSRTGSGNQKVAGLSGSVEAVTGSGEILVDRIGGDVNARTGSGSIEAREIEGRFSARTGSGSIRLTSSRAGDVDATSGSGSIELSGFDGAMSARAGSGSITIAGTPAGPWRAETGSGSIIVRVPAGIGFDVDAHTGSGGIDVEQPVTVTGSLARTTLNGRVGSGGPQLRFRTGSGSIRIAQQ